MTSLTEHLQDFGDRALTALLGIQQAQAAPPVGRALSRAKRAMIPDVVPPHLLHPEVVKERGGQWLTGPGSSLGSFLAGLQEKSFLWDPHLGEDPVKVLARLAPVSHRPEAVFDVETGVIHGQTDVDLLKQQIAFNDWITGPLAKYIVRDMATPEDPIRALAERGVLHYDPREHYLPHGTIEDAAVSTRESAGFPAGGLARTPLGQAWEAFSDIAVSPERVGDRMLNQNTLMLNQYPWLEKLDPETLVHHFIPRELGFFHLRDELRNALRDEGLPQNLRLRTKDFNRMSVPQAVEHVAKINAWRAKQAEIARRKAAQEQLVVAFNPATHEVKTYPEAGLRWVELKPPEITRADQLVNPEALSKYTQYLSTAPDNPEMKAAALKKAAQLQSHRALQDALTYEGKMAGHCVGGYCPQVEAGETRIFSLRDKSGVPQVTVEVAPGLDRGEAELVKLVDIPRGLRQRAAQYAVAGNVYRNKELPDQFARPEDFSGRILQVKGPRNQPPKKEYLPMIQDFIKSGGYEVSGDLNYTGLVDLSRDIALPWDRSVSLEEANRFIYSIDPSHDQFQGRSRILRRAQEELGRYVTPKEFTDWARKRVK